LSVTSWVISLRARAIRSLAPLLLVLVGLAGPGAAAPPAKPEPVVSERDRICSARCASQQRAALEYEQCLRECFELFRGMPAAGAAGAAAPRK